MKWPEILLGVYVLYALWKGYQKGLVGVLLDWVGLLLALALVYALFSGGTAFLEKLVPPAMIRDGGKPWPCFWWWWLFGWGFGH